MTSNPIARSAIAMLRLASQGVANATATTPLDVVAQLGAIQAQDYPGARWTIGLRSVRATRADVEQAILERTIIRTWPMRGTLHFVPAVDARWMLELMTPRILKGAAGRHRQLELDAATFKRSRALISKVLNKTPVMTREALFATLDAGSVLTTGQRGIHILQQSSSSAAKDRRFVVLERSEGPAFVCRPQAQRRTGGLSSSSGAKDLLLFVVLERSEGPALRSRTTT